jgi:hypothetical protein
MLPKPSMITLRSDRLIAVTLVSLTLTVATPLGVYLNNVDEFNFGLLDFFPTSLALLLLAIGLLMGLERLMRPVLGERRVYVLLSCVFYLLWCQANVLQWHYGPLEQGDWYQKWQYGVIDSAIWVTVLLAGFVFSDRLAPFLSKMNRWALVVLCISIALTSTKVPYRKSAYALDEAPLFDLSSERNVIVFLLDQTQSDVFRELATEGEFREHFRGFKFFADYMSNAQNTSLSVPMSLTGRYYDNSVKYGDFVREAMRTVSLPKALKDIGFRTDLYFRYNIFANDWIDPSFVSNFKATGGYRLNPSAQVNDLSLFVSLPHFAKLLIYNDQDWLLQSRLKSIALDAIREMGRFLERAYRKPGHHQVGGDNRTARGDADTAFAFAFMKHAKLSGSQPRFKFYHWVGAHGPFRLDENGDPIPREKWGTPGTYRQKVKYKMRLLVQIFDRLKELNIYDRSMIVIMSDHGNGLRDDTRQIRDPYTKQIGFHTYETCRANALLMLKDVGSDQPLEMMAQPLQSLDVKELIYRIVRGESLPAILAQFPRYRVRKFFNYGDNVFRPYAIQFRELLVVGPVWRPESFIPFHTHSAGQAPEQCPFAEGHVRYWGDLIGTDRLRVIDDHQLRVLPPDNIGASSKWLALFQVQAAEAADRGSTSDTVVKSMLRSVRVEAANTSMKHLFGSDYGLVGLQGRGRCDVRLIDAAGDFGTRLNVTALHFFEMAHQGDLQ